MSGPASILSRDGFADAWKRATALPGEPHWDEDLSIPCEAPPSAMVGLFDSIPLPANPVHALGDDAE
jgi:hypothetical protein